MAGEHMKRSLLILALTTSVSAAVEYGNRTHYSVRQHDTGIAREQSVWHQHTTNDIGNTHGLSVQLTPFVSFSTHNRGIGKQFGRLNKPEIPIDSDRDAVKAETTFPYHSIVHDVAGDSTTEETATLTLKPSITQTGAILNLFHDGGNVAPGLTFQLGIPMVQVKTKLLTSGGSSTLRSYFAGTFSQDTVTQDALLYGKTTSTQQTALGPVTVQVGYNVVETPRSFASIIGGFSIATLTPSAQHHLFSAHHANYDHHKLLCGIDAGSIIWQRDDVHIELLCSARYSYLFAGTEKRIVGVHDDDGGNLIFSPFRLAAQEGIAGVFPLANILQRNVSIDSRHQLETNVMAAFSCNGWTANLGYGLFAREEDKVTVHDWDEGTYAIAHSKYPAATAFSSANAVHSDGRRLLTRDMLNTVAAQSPAQISVILSAGGGYASQHNPLPYTMGMGVSFEHGIVNAAPSMLTLWVKGSLSF